MDSASTSSTTSTMPQPTARCIYNSNHSRMRYTLVPYNKEYYTTTLLEAIKGYEHFIHGYIQCDADNNWDIFDTKKDAGLIIKPILEALSENKKIHNFMKPDAWLIVRGTPSEVQEVIGEMLLDDAYVIEAYDIWKIKMDGKHYNVAVATEIDYS